MSFDDSTLASICVIEGLNFLHIKPLIRGGMDSKGAHEFGPKNGFSLL